MISIYLSNWSNICLDIIYLSLLKLQPVLGFLEIPLIFLFLSRLCWQKGFDFLAIISFVIYISFFKFRGKKPCAKFLAF